MAKTKRSTAKKTRRKTPRKSQPQFNFWHQHHWQIIGGLLIMLNFLSLFRLGIIGLWWDDVLQFISGDFAWLSAIFLMIAGVYCCWQKPALLKQHCRYLGGAGCVYLALLLADSAWYFHNDTFSYHFANWGQTLVNNASGDHISVTATGGLVGNWLYQWTHLLVAQFGTYVIVALLFASGLLLFFNISFKQVWQWFKQVGQLLMQQWQRVRTSWQDHRQAMLTKQADVQHDDEAVTDEVPTVAETMPNSMAAPLPSAAPTADDLPTPELKEKILPHRSHAEELDEHHAAIKPTPTNAVPHSNQNYQLPPLSLLTKVANADQSQERKLIAFNKQKLKATFDSFKVDVAIKDAVMGPAVTRYEIQPAIGVKVSKIVNLSDDLALALAAKDLRIEAPIPGKSLIGIEVPNRTVAMVGFRDVMAPQYFHQDRPLEVPLGRDIEGNVITCDLSKMPHLLIAGATGSGKSVMINDMITALLMRNRPEAVKLMLIDPKMVELNAYNDVPHLLTPVVTDSRKAADALNKAVKEMERRYNVFAKTGVHKMQEYNQKVANDPSLGEPMPYIVIVVDELADLMMVAGNEVESAIIRLAQMARAAGMHMIIATQRPSVDVITGLIKANIPSRIAFAVSSSIDARTILDTSGAEKLLGRGDMLYKPMDVSKPVRVQGAYIATQDVVNVVDFIKQEQTAVYDDNMMPTAAPAADDEQSSTDELYPEAVAFVAQKKAASVSMLQRRFRIGYNRAARLVDEMEAQGIVGPMMGSKPRQVFLDKIKTNEQEEQ